MSNDKIEKILDSTVGRNCWKDTSIVYKIQEYSDQQNAELKDKLEMKTFQLKAADSDYNQQLLEKDKSLATSIEYGLQVSKKCLELENKLSEKDKDFFKEQERADSIRMDLEYKNIEINKLKAKLNECIPFITDAIILHKKNGCHQEFISEDGVFLNEVLLLIEPKK